jgi:hypothetical protein
MIGQGELLNEKLLNENGSLIPQMSFSAEISVPENLAARSMR